MIWLSHEDRYRLVDYEDGILALEFWNTWQFVPSQQYADRYRALEAFEKLSKTNNLNRYLYANEVDYIVHNN